MIRTEHGWKIGDWETWRTMVEEFDGPWGREDMEQTRRQILVQRFLAKQPRVSRSGFEYDAPYTLGLHLAALRDARDRGIM